ncbi:MAG: sigma-70 family RNA polymerase sigma factor [Planctomycetes bacterium]|nr:sigma-70 family RNA polymerase sigma factor [Planctomycetota bacterium]
MQQQDPKPGGSAWDRRTTRWTMIQHAAGNAGSDEVDRAWHALVERYREPVEYSLRRLLGSGHAAEEASTAFFGYLFEQKILPKVDRAQGKFRQYMQAVLRRYVHDYVRSLGRRGASLSEAEFVALQGDPEVEADEERQWARRSFALVLQAMLAEMPGVAPVFLDSTGLWPLVGKPDRPRLDRDQLAEKWQITKNNVDQRCFRARSFVREQFRAEVSDLLVADADDAAVGDERLERELSLLQTRLAEALQQLTPAETAALFAAEPDSVE